RGGGPPSPRRPRRDHAPARPGAGLPAAGPAAAAARGLRAAQGGDVPARPDGGARALRTTRRSLGRRRPSRHGAVAAAAPAPRARGPRDRRPLLLRDALRLAAPGAARGLRRRDRDHRGARRGAGVPALPADPARGPAGSVERAAAGLAAVRPDARPEPRRGPAVGERRPGGRAPGHDGDRAGPDVAALAAAVGVRPRPCAAQRARGAAAPDRDAHLNGRRSRAPARAARPASCPPGARPRANSAPRVGAPTKLCGSRRAPDQGGDPVSGDLIDTTEMYLKTVFELHEAGIAPMRARIAERLGHSGPTVSQTVARMERDGLLYLDDQRRIRLTAE